MTQEEEDQLVRDVMCALTSEERFNEAQDGEFTCQVCGRSIDLHMTCKPFALHSLDGTVGWGRTMG